MDKSYKKKIKKERHLARSKPKKSPYDTIHIICEGQTEYCYFTDLVKFFRLNTANVSVATSKGSAPISVVDHALEIAQENFDIDKIACVFDKDNHESYKRAIDKLNSNNCDTKSENPATEIHKVVNTLVNLENNTYKKSASWKGSAQTNKVMT